MSNSNSNNSNNSNNNRLEITNPSKEDWKKIIITMLIFALLQGALTLYLY